MPWRFLDRLHPSSLEASIRLASLPALVRGYETVKLANVQRYRAAFRAQGEALGIAVRRLPRMDPNPRCTEAPSPRMRAERLLGDR